MGGEHESVCFESLLDFYRGTVKEKAGAGRRELYLRTQLGAQHIGRLFRMILAGQQTDK